MNRNLEIKEIPFEELNEKKVIQPLFVPSEADIVEGLTIGLRKNFKDVNVCWKACPDLTKEPFNLSAPGLGGSRRYMDIGGEKNLFPLPRVNRIYDLTKIPELADVGAKDTFIIGAGAADWTIRNQNSEFMPNMMITRTGNFVQESRISYTIDNDSKHKTETLTPDQKRSSILGNFYISEGKPGKVIEVKVKGRIGEESLLTGMRQALVDFFPGKFMAMGGTFVALKGRVRIHVMPHFSDIPLNSKQDVENWLKFFEVATPFTATGAFVTDHMNLDFRLHHAHGLNRTGEAGHYHNDTTPDVAEYIGYFHMAESCYRVDRPGTYLDK